MIEPFPVMTLNIIFSQESSNISRKE